MKNIKYYNSIQECLGDKTAMSPNVALVEGCSNEDQLVYTDVGEVPIRFYEDSEKIEKYFEGLKDYLF